MNRVRTATALIAVALAASAPAEPQSAAGLLTSFFEALNSDDPNAIVEFYRTGVTEELRSRHSPAENQAFYQRVRDDLGKLTVEGLRRVSPAKAIATLRAQKLDMPVEFAFDLADGKIDGFSVQVGGPPDGGGALLDLPENASFEEISEALDRQLRDLVAQDKFSGVVLLARDGKPVFHRGYGLAERASGRGITTATRFDVGSITKLITKIAIAQLAQAGKLELTDTLFEHLPGYPNPAIAKRITIQQLLDHASGLGDIFTARWEAADRSRFIEPDDYFQLFADQPLAFEPGTKRAYSNAGYVTLGAVVAAVSGQPYFDYVVKNIFERAGMDASGFQVKDGSDPEIAIGYTRGGPSGGRTDATGPLEPNLGMLPLRGCPAGSSTHTALDLLRLDQALRSGTLLDPERSAWVLRAEPGTDLASAGIGVAGGGPGVSAGWDSDGSMTAIVLANLDPPAGEGLAMELARTLRRSETR